MPVTATPNSLPASSNDTSAVGGSTERTRLTSRLPFISPILSPNIRTTSLSPDLELQLSGRAQCKPAMGGGTSRNRLDMWCHTPLHSLCLVYSSQFAEKESGDCQRKGNGFLRAGASARNRTCSACRLRRCARYAH